MPGWFDTPTPVTDYEQKIVDMIGEYGWFCTGVFDPNGVDPNFSYTVGFSETLGTPELIIFGLDLTLMHKILGLAFDQIKEGRDICEGDRWSGLIEGFDCISRAVHPTNITQEYFNSALWYHGDPVVSGPMEAFQLVWPGALDGLYPWDSNCAQEVRDWQPPLYFANTALH